MRFYHYHDGLGVSDSGQIPFCYHLLRFRVWGGLGLGAEGWGLSMRVSGLRV